MLICYTKLPLITVTALIFMLQSFDQTPKGHFLLVLLQLHRHLGRYALLFSFRSSSGSQLPHRTEGMFV